MMKNRDFKNWMIGVSVVFLITFIIYSYIKAIFPTCYFSFLEWFGIIMMVVLVKTGIDTYNKN